MKKIILLIFVFSVACLSQQMRFTGNEINLGSGRIFSGAFIEGIAGTSITFGQVVYSNSWDNKLYLADEDIDSTINGINYICVDASLTANKKGRFLYTGFYKDTSLSLIKGEDICVGASAGSINDGACTVKLGYAVDTITIALYAGDVRTADISGGDTSHYSLFDWVIGLQDTVDAIQALIGSGGSDTTYVYQAIALKLTASAFDDSVDHYIDNTAYNATTWDGDTIKTASRNAVRDKIQTMISDSAYAANWDGNGGVAPSKNAIYDQFGVMQSALNGYQPVPVEVIVNESGTAVSPNTFLFIVQTGEDPLSYSNEFVTGSLGFVYVYVQNIVVGGTVTLNFGNVLNGTDANIDLTILDNGSTFIFVYSPTLTYWYQIL